MDFSKKLVFLLLALGAIVTILISISVEADLVPEPNNNYDMQDKKNRLTRFARDDDEDDLYPPRNKAKKGARKGDGKVNSKPAAATTTKKPSATTAKGAATTTANPNASTITTAKANGKVSTTAKGADNKETTKKTDDDSDEKELDRLRVRQTEEREILLTLEEAIKKWDAWIRVHDMKTLNKNRATRMLRMMQNIFVNNHIILRRQGNNRLKTREGHVTGGNGGGGYWWL